jgi:hypothetical protein
VSGLALATGLSVPYRRLAPKPLTKMALSI